MQKLVIGRNEAIRYYINREAIHFQLKNIRRKTKHLFVL